MWELVWSGPPGRKTKGELKDARRGQTGASKVQPNLPAFGGGVVHLGAASRLASLALPASTLIPMQTNIDPASSTRDFRPEPLPSRAKAGSFVSVVVLLIVIGLVSLIIWPG